MIEKNIHQIWIGPRQMPPQFQAWCGTWRTKHPTWSYKLWRSEDLPPLINHYTYTKFEALVPEPRRYGLQADLVRYELLARFGGLYVDVDNECLKPLDELLSGQEFVVSMEPVYEDRIPNDFIACRAGHPLAWDLVRTVERSVKAAELQFLEGAVVNMLELVGPKYLKRIIDQANRADVTILPYQLIHPRRRWLEDVSSEYEGAAYMRNHFVRDAGMWAR